METITVAQSHSPNAVRRSSWIDTGTTTAPAGQIAWRKAQVAALDAGEPSPPYPAISDDDIRATLECNQLRLLRERGADMTIFSPRPSTMAPYIGDETAAKAWARTNSDLIARCVALYLPIFRRRLHAAAESAGRSGRVDRRALMLRTRPRLYRLQPQSPIAAAATSARRR